MIETAFIIYAIVAVIVAAWLLTMSGDWREHVLAIVFGGLWLFVLMLLGAVMFSDWRAARRNRGRIL